jgi:hypothetical protein
VGRLAVLMLSIRLCYLFMLYVLGWANVQRFHVESAALLLVMVGFGLRLLRSRVDSRLAGNSRRVPPGMWAIYVGLALVLYWPGLQIGFLSDDFLLIDRASHWNIGPVTLGLFRPVPLFVWAVLLHVGGGPVIIHAVNIVLHATNAYLTARLVSGWLENRDWSVLAGLIMLTAPLAPEAVVWCSGVFDVSATAFVLTAVLLSRNYRDDVSVSARSCFFVVGILAVMSKESAAILPILVILDAWVRQTMPRKLLQDTAVLFVVFAIFSAVRLAMRFGVTSPPLRFRMLRRGLFWSFGGLSFPWHVELLRSSAVPVLCAGLVVIVLVTAFLLRKGPMSAVRLALACAIWIIVAILPVFSTFYVSPDLQASRYLYLSCVGWAALLVALGADAESGRAWTRIVPRAAIVTWVIVAAYGTRQHLDPWIGAARLRDIVEQRAAENPRMQQCNTLRLTKLPDNVRGAYVFRVGAGEDFQHKFGQNVLAVNEAGPCSFSWDERTLSFSPFRN